MMIFLVLFDIFITLGSIGTIALVVIWFKFKNNDLFERIVQILSIVVIGVFITFPISFIFLYRVEFDGLHDMRPVTELVTNTLIGNILLTYPMLIFIVVRSGFFIYSVAMDPHNISPNKKGFSETSMAEQIKDEAERFGQGDNFK